MHSRSDIDPAIATNLVEESESTHSLAHFVGVLRRYLDFIVISVATVLFIYVVIAASLYLFGPSQELTTLPFRAVFEGADAGEYPNGLPFNSSEIVATPVLQRVFNDQNLGRFISFDELKSSLFVLEANKELERLSLEYQAKLSDPKLSAVDRDRLEREFDLKKESIRRSDFSLNMSLAARTKTIPENLRVQTLNAILRSWAEQAMQEKGAGMYRIPVVSRNIFDLAPASDDYFVAADILRTKVRRVLTAIDRLLRVPGAEVVRSRDNVTLPEVRANLDDTRRFRIEPLIATIRAHRLTKNPAMSEDFLRAQLLTARRERDRERSHVNTLQSSLELYMQRGTPAQPQATTTGGQNKPQQSLPSQTLIPQIDKSFLDQIVDLAAQQRDLDYRQKLINDLNTSSISELLPAEEEVAYYESLLQPIPASGPAPSPDTIAAQYQRAQNEALRGVDQVTSIYRLMSRNLNPGNAVYSTTDPPQHQVVRAWSARRLGLIGILVGMLATALIIVACVLHNRLREEEAEDSQLAAARIEEPPVSAVHR